MTTKIPVELSSTPGIVDGSNATAITIDSSERVGVGNASPSHLLHVNAADGASDNTQAMTIENNEATDGRSYGLKIKAGSTANDASLFVQDHDASNDHFIIRGNGNVGIGTTSPSNTLHTSGTGVQRIQIDATDNNAAGAGLYMKVLNSGSLVGNATVRVDNVGNINFFNGTSSDSEKMRIDSSGRVGINRTPTKTNSKLEIGGADNVPLIQMEASGNFGGFGIGSNALNMYYNDSKFMYVNNVGDVYIPSGSLHVGTTSTTGVVDGGLRLTFPSNESDGDLFFVSNGGGSNATPVLMYVVQGEGFSSNHGAMAVGKHTGNSRSINAGGTVNASGNDYAEYMVKSSGCGDIAKGDVVGIDADGKLTKTFSAAKSFVIKSTDPSYVGGDTWWTEKEPEPKYTDDTKSNKTEDFIDWETRMETARGTVDRIAFSGQVPVNITGSFNVGDYVYPQVNSSGIKAVAKSSPTFEEYQLCVGKIWATMEDGRPLVAVKIG
jgi:hypothetical protein